MDYHYATATLRTSEERELTLCSGIESERRATQRKMEEVEHPSFEERVAGARHGPDECSAEDWNWAGMGLERFTQRSEQFSLFF